MLKNAYLYEEEIKNAFYETWYDPKYQYYYMGPYHNDWGCNHNEGDYYRRNFASVDSEGELIGYISYNIEHDIKSAGCFGAINFSDNITTFGMDLVQVIDDIFCKFNMNRLEFAVVCGNPIEKNYDRMIHKYGGRILCTRHNACIDMQGNLCNDKLYELLKEDYLACKKAEKSGLRLKDIEDIIDQEEYHYGEEELTIDSLNVVMDKACVVIPSLHLIVNEASVLDDNGYCDYCITIVHSSDGTDLLYWEQSDILTTLANMHIEDYTMDKLAVTRCYICSKEELIK